jgi:hypothetical protein
MALARPIVAAAPSVLLFEKSGFADLEHPEATSPSQGAHRPSSPLKEAGRCLTA